LSDILLVLQHGRNSIAAHFHLGEKILMLESEFTSVDLTGGALCLGSIVAEKEFAP